MSKQESFYVAIKPHNGGVCISKSKNIISKFLGISVDTIDRKLAVSGHYESFGRYELYSYVCISRIKRGFAL